MTKCRNNVTITVQTNTYAYYFTRSIFFYQEEMNQCVDNSVAEEVREEEVKEEEQMKEENEPRNCNPEAFERLVCTIKIQLYKTGMAILKNDDDTCDAIQETLISAYKSFQNLKNKEYFNTWITRILINKCYDIIRNNKKISYINKEMESLSLSTADALDRKAQMIPLPKNIL